MGKIMYVNFKKGEPKYYVNHTVTPAYTRSFPVEVLFNENSTSGEVRPLKTDSVMLHCDDGKDRLLTYFEGENRILSHEDLSEEPISE